MGIFEQLRMKRKHRVLAILCVLSVCLLTGCGYNPIMYAHLSDRNNYETYTVQIEKIIYPDADEQISVGDTSVEKRSI